MKLDKKLQDWIVARKRHRLSDAHVQMARELGMNPTPRAAELPWSAAACEGSASAPARRG